MQITSYTYNATLDHVQDGDSVVLTLDLGFRLSARLPIRLLGLNCHERTTPAGINATAFSVKWFADHATGTFRVATVKNPEKYGRWLGIIFGGSDTVSLNDSLITAGLALPWDGKGVKPV